MRDSVSNLSFGMHAYRGTLAARHMTPCVRAGLWLLGVNYNSLGVSRLGFWRSRWMISASSVTASSSWPWWFRST